MRAQQLGVWAWVRLACVQGCATLRVCQMPTHPACLASAHWRTGTHTHTCTHAHTRTHTARTSAPLAELSLMCYMAGRQQVVMTPLLAGPLCGQRPARKVPPVHTRMASGLKCSVLRCAVLCIRACTRGLCSKRHGCKHAEHALMCSHACEHVCGCACALVVVGVHGPRMPLGLRHMDRGWGCSWKEWP